MGDFKYNQDRIYLAIKKAQQLNAELVIFPEGALFGYPPFDLLECGISVDRQLIELAKLHKKIPKGLTVFVGCFSKNPKKRGRPFYNSVAVLKANSKIKYLNKTLLPTGDVFDESRFCETGDMAKNIIKISGKSVLVTICEDIWAWSPNSLHKNNPIKNIEKSKVDLVINMSASPFYLDKWEQRLENVANTAKYFSAPVVYLNAVGAQDELIFDGRSFCVDATGQVTAQLAAFIEDEKSVEIELISQPVLLKSVFPIKRTKSLKNQNNKDNKEVEAQLLRQAITLGIRDYCIKVGIKKIHLGLSGGIDSAVVACLACEAIGAEKVTGIALPGPFNASESYSLAKKLSTSLNINFFSWKIDPHFKTFKKEIEKYLNIKKLSLVHENLQARLRGIILMMIANADDSLLLSTSNKSEIATGYSTLYGDMCGGLAPIGDLTKAQVYALAQIYYKEKNWIPLKIIERAPSAELRPNQKDQDSLPPYPQLDAAVENLVEKIQAPKSKTENWLASILFRNEFKRWQSPPILKVSSHAFGRGRRFPIAHRFKF